ncbi:hypothetical protein PGH12_19025 [Chryseobacterium wangxinyae]|uniref:hypothetical protein n=1 Tax=Chryseobacterium sp. CY350 TaxID=2997336 RepID=UPI00226F72D8|nr:hypothetical protein [Chryseobacterium sp. CY350]MCY0977449.1 hypothetical protein [Chryseobacterium sp. CY350]WBZ95536.1 hypothetical protein PGH12_19025 [Chryseobacterium sp. CY350]
MKTYFSFFFIFSTLYYYSQKITVLDSIDHKTISYVEFIVDGNSYFSDSLGTIELTKKNEQPIFLKKNGYEEQKKANYNRIIYLKPIIKDIEEVIIKNKKNVEFASKSINKNTTKLPNDLTIGFKIKGKENISGKLQKISIPVKRIYANNTLLKIDFYNFENDVIDKEILNNESIFINVNDLTTKKNNVIDLHKYNIPIIGNILISIRIIDETGLTDKNLKEPSIQFYNSKEKGNIYFYNQYLKDWKILSNDINLISFSYTISY